jgi:hypothetical protein
MRKLVSCDVVEVEYNWCHNHADSAQARAKLPLGKNELEWTKSKIATGQDWKAIRSQLRLSKEVLDLVCTVQRRTFLPPLCRLFIQPALLPSFLPISLSFSFFYFGAILLFIC